MGLGKWDQITCDQCNMTLFPEKKAVQHGTAVNYWCEGKHVALLMKAQQFGKSKPSTAHWICLRCSFLPEIQKKWEAWLWDTQDLMGRTEEQKGICSGCKEFTKAYVEEVMREQVAGRVQVGGSAGAVTSPPGSAPAASSPPASLVGSAAPCWNLEVQGMKLDILNIKRRQAETYEEEKGAEGISPHGPA